MLRNLLNFLSYHLGFVCLVAVSVYTLLDVYITVYCAPFNTLVDSINYATSWHKTLFSAGQFGGIQ